MISEFFAYTAGYIDGDGCIYLGKFRQGDINIYEYSIQIVSVKRQILDRFQEKYGGSVRKKPFKPKHRDAFCWTIKGDATVTLSKLILPFLIEKKIQCASLIKFSLLIQHNKFRAISQALITERENIINNARYEKHTNNLITKEAIEKLKDKRSTITPTVTDYHYIAGLIDAEGCFRIKKWKPKNKPNHVYAISVEIGSAKLPVLAWLIERFGGSIVFTSPKKEHWKAFAIWSLSAAALFKMLPKIKPFLTNKQEVCNMLTEFQTTILANGGDRHSIIFKNSYETQIELRERIVQKIHDFNRKGIPN